MMKTNRYIRTGAAAIASALALSSTSVLAQDAPPVAEVPIASDPAPVAIETTPAADPAPAPSEPAIDTSAAVTPKAVAKPKAAAAPAKAPPAAPTLVQAPAANTAADTVVAPEPATAEPIAAPVMAPIEPTAEPMTDGGSAQIAFGGALALLALGGAALALSRRRRTRHMTDEHAYAPIAAPAPAVGATADYARPAFAWDNANPALVTAKTVAAESPSERARRGPTPDNPSLSLKKRLKRATFFEQRQREVAAGKAKPVNRLAGLPERLVEAAQPPRFTTPGYGRVLQPA